MTSHRSIRCTSRATRRGRTVRHPVCRRLYRPALRGFRERRSGPWIVSPRRSPPITGHNRLGQMGIAQPGAISNTPMITVAHSARTGLAYQVNPQANADLPNCSWVLLQKRRVAGLVAWRPRVHRIGGSIGRPDLPICDRGYDEIEVDARPRATRPSGMSALNIAGTWRSTPSSSTHDQRRTVMGEPLLPGTDTLPGGDTLPVEGHVWPGQAAAEGRGQVHLVDGRGFALRHVRPGAVEGAAIRRCARHGPRLRVAAHVQTSTTLPRPGEGSYSRRLVTPGEFTVEVPNATQARGSGGEFSEAGARRVDRNLPRSGARVLRGDPAGRDHPLHRDGLRRATGWTAQAGL